MIPLTYSALSERGLRPKNDDATFAGRIGNSSVFIIADGMQGHAHNDYVNTIAIQAVTDALHASGGSPRDALEAGIRAADEKIRDLAGKFQNSAGYATKLVACTIDDDLWCTALDTGDGNCRVITETTIEDAQAAARSRTPYTSRAGGQDPEPPVLSDMISHVLGAPRRLKAADFPQFMLRDEYLLLSSDGLTDHLGETAIADIVRTRGQDSPGAATEALIQEALRAGSESTITVILIRREAA